MKITWIIPKKSVVGGIRVVFEYANHLTDLGHDVTCVCPFEQFPYPQNNFRKAELWLRKKIYYPLKLKKNKSHVSRANWFQLKAKLIEAPDLSAKYVPDADVVIATAWDTAEWVKNYPDRCGTKFYFIQHYEVWAGPKERVDKTYKMRLKKITIASWLTKKMEGFNEKVYATINNAIDPRQFFNNNKVYHQPRRLGLLYHGSDWKGTRDGLKTFELVKAKFPKVKLIMFGVKKSKNFLIPKEADFFENPPQEKIREIYSEMDIFMSTSWTEGFGLTAMEAMACGCAVVSTDSGGISDFSVPNKTVLISPPKDSTAMAKNIIRLLEDKNKLKQLSEAGCEYVKQFTWNKSAKQLEETLLSQR